MVDIANSRPFRCAMVAWRFALDSANQLKTLVKCISSKILTLAQWQAPYLCVGETIRLQRVQFAQILTKDVLCVSLFAGVAYHRDAAKFCDDCHGLRAHPRGTGLTGMLRPKLEPEITK